MGAEGTLHPFWKSNIQICNFSKSLPSYCLLLSSLISFSMQSTAILFVKLSYSSKKVGSLQRTEFDAPNSIVTPLFSFVKPLREGFLLSFIRKQETMMRPQCSLLFLNKQMSYSSQQVCVLPGLNHGFYEINAGRHQGFETSLSCTILFSTQQTNGAPAAAAGAPSPAPFCSR